MNRVLLALLVMMWSVSCAFAACIPGDNWTVTWTDPGGETVYTLEGPCKAYIGVPFDIVATVTDASYPDSNVGGLWTIRDNGTTIDSGGVLGISLSGGQWQKVITQTYSGAAIDHTIEFAFTDYGSGGGAHNYAGSVIGSLTVDPYIGLLPQTGQTGCWDAAGNPLACSDPLAKGQDGAVRAGVPWPEPRFADNGDGTVTDHLTGLVWLKDANCFGGRDWVSALNSANSLASGSCGLMDGSVAGDWRLPNREELNSLVNRQENVDLWLDEQAFSNVQAYHYWTSSSYASDPAIAWVFDLSGTSGDRIYAIWKTPNFYVWPVRSQPINSSSVSLPKTGQTGCWDADGNQVACADTGQDGDHLAGVPWPAPRFADNGDGTVTDNLTGLIWLKNANCMDAVGGVYKNGVGEATWATAVDWSNLLAHGSCGLTDGSTAGDWRLPNSRELESLANAQEPDTKTWLNGQGFLGVDAIYWTSTTHPVVTSQAFSVYFGPGYTYAHSKNNTHHVWPVRGGTLDPVLPPCKAPRSIYVPAGNASGIYQVRWDRSGTVGAEYVLYENGVEVYRGLNTYYNVTGQGDGSYVYAVQAVRAGYTDSELTTAPALTVALTCTTPKQLYVPATNTTGYYQVRWDKSTTPGVEYVLYENGVEAYRGANTYYNVREKAGGNYAYAVKAVKPGYADSELRTAAALAVTPTCATPKAVYAPAANGTGSYQVRWDKSTTPGVSYVLEVNGGSGWAAVAGYTNASLTYMNLSGVGAGSYQYRVQATKAGLVPSDWKTSGTVTVN